MLMCSGFYLQHDVKERIVIRVRPEAGQVCVCVFLPGGLNSAQLDALVITGSILKKEIQMNHAQYNNQHIYFIATMCVFLNIFS